MNVLSAEESEERLYQPFNKKIVGSLLAHGAEIHSVDQQNKKKNSAKLRVGQKFQLWLNIFLINCSTTKTNNTSFEPYYLSTCSWKHTQK